MRFNSDYLTKYMQMVENTESPRIFHVWAALSSISVTLGRRCYFPFGDGKILPNQYILLIGTPGTRKSTAISPPKKLVKRLGTVRLAPTDTGGQRQGLVLAMYGKKEKEEDDSKEYVGNVELGAAQGNQINSLADFAEITNVPDEEEELVEVDDADKHSIYVLASEFSRVIGQSNMSMLDFLGERYDGESYDYLTRQTDIKMPHTLMNILACSTPVSMSEALPVGAGGQGFLSRFVLVHGAEKYRKVPWPTPFDDKIKSELLDVLEKIKNDFRGEFSQTPAAKAYAAELYGYEPDIPDSRFVYYQERRQTHLIKVAMALAASRGTMTIDLVDYKEAHRILCATEVGMPEALGEFGMNPMAAVKQELLEQLREAQAPMSVSQVVSMFHRDATMKQIMEVIRDLVQTGMVKQIKIRDSGKMMLTATHSNRSTEERMMEILQGELEC